MKSAIEEQSGSKTNVMKNMASKLPKRATARKKVKATGAKAKPRAARPSATASGYSDTAARLVARGKSALGDAYAWAGEAGSALPRTARGLSLPDQRTVRDYVAERPLILGAVGLGIGMALGAMMPARNGVSKPAPHKSRRK
ncbi:MAG: hypothetical protein ACKVP5_03280 [Aestuariivirga sp.]